MLALAFSPMVTFLQLQNIVLNIKQISFNNQQYQVIELVLTRIWKSTAVAAIGYKVSDDQQ